MALQLKNTRSLLTGLTLCAAMASSFTFAATPGNQPGNSGSYGNWSWSGHIDHVTFDEEAAAKPTARIEDTATALGFAAEYYTNTSENTLSLGMNFLFYRDNAAFRQYVEDYWGDEGYSESDATALMVFAEYGPKYRFGQDNMSFFVVRGGASGIFASERGISSCYDCYSEDIDIDGGVYGLLGIGHTLGSIDLSLQFQQYFSGDLDNALRLKISGAF